MDVTELIVSLVYNDKGKVIGEKYHGELIRCRDCKHRNRYECNHIKLGETKCGVTDDWFCADGERKEHETD